MFGAGSVGNSSKVFTLLTLIPFGILIVMASISPDFDPKYARTRSHLKFIIALPISYRLILDHVFNHIMSLVDG